MPAAKARPKPYVNWAKVPVLLSVHQLSILFDEDEQVIRQQARDGLIPGMRKIGKKWFGERDTIQRYFAGEDVQRGDLEVLAALVADKIKKEITYNVQSA